MIAVLPCWTRRLRVRSTRALSAYSAVSVGQPQFLEGRPSDVHRRKKEGPFGSKTENLTASIKSALPPLARIADIPDRQLGAKRSQHSDLPGSGCRNAANRSIRRAASGMFPSCAKRRK